VDTLNAVLGVLNVVLVLIALGVAWLTVREARRSNKEAREERVARRLAELADAVAEVGRGLNGVQLESAKQHHSRLTALLVAFEPTLPKTRELASFELDSRPLGTVKVERSVRESQSELRTFARSLELGRS